MKELGERVLGWFVETEDDEVPDVEVPVEEAPPVEPETALAGASRAPDPSPPGERDDVRKVMDLIAALPDGAPLEVKRAIVTASLEAFGIRIDRVLAAAAETERALERKARVIAQEIATQEEAAKSVATERARLRAVGVFFGRS